MSVTKKQKNEANKALRLLKSLLSGQSVDSSIETLQNNLDELPISESNSTGGAFSLTPDLIKFDFIAFSDGACRGNPGPGAWGSLVQRVDESVIYEGSGIEVNTTNNRMELQGAIEALKFICSFSEFNKSQSVVLVSDSKYVVDGMNQWVVGWKKRGWKKADKKTPENIEQWQELDRLKESFDSLIFQWVKGHAGHPQNEHCDQLANVALDEAGF
jgi:ribonuclease HI